MFESAEMGHSIPKAQYEREEPKLREALLKAQYDLKERNRFPAIVLIAGVEGAGKGETVNLLNEWMDPRHIHTHAFGPPTDEESQHPPMWRFWRALPPKGSIGIFFGHWYTMPVIDRVMGHTKRAELDRSIEKIERFERMLYDEGALILKFWFHLSKQAQRQRLETLGKDPRTRWRVSPLDWKFFKSYDKFRKVSEYTLRETSSAFAPWIVVEGADANYRNLTVGKMLLSAMRDRLDGKQRFSPDDVGPPLLPPIDNRRLVQSLDLSLALPKKKYEKAMEKYQGQLNLLSRHPQFKQRGVVAVFEGQDAAGKGGAIRRITGALDARWYQVVPIAAPTEDELAQPYLWRFWRRIPRHGRFTIFDRSWYGRVLVERVEGFAGEFDWMRAYAEINDFEEDLSENGLILCKFWLAISQDEQLRRFKEREKTGYKRYKITREDWRNRKKWRAYDEAVSDMVDRTSTDIAPWTLVEANDKYHARIKVLATLCERIETQLSSS